MKIMEKEIITIRELPIELKKVLIDCEQGKVSADHTEYHVLEFVNQCIQARDQEIKEWIKLNAYWSNDIFDNLIVADHFLQFLSTSKSKVESIDKTKK